MDNLLKQTLKRIPQLPQTEESLRDQIKDLVVVANKFGLYDAADWLKEMLDTRAPR